jgi:peptidoglycan/xylan/chitin deacetylase (PgdA/CDA1 family)
MKPLALTVMMYHYVRDPGDRAEAGSGIPGLAVSQFEAQLDSLARRYDMIAWPDLRAYLIEGKPLPSSACLLTFDDGVRDHYLNVFPALRARGLCGLFFALARRSDEGLALGHKIHFLRARLGLAGLREAIRERLSSVEREVYERAETRYRARWHSELDVFKSIVQRDLSAEADTILSQLIAEHIGREEAIAAEYYLTADQISEMAANGMHFGGHSHSHPWFDWVDIETQAKEIKASAEWLRDVEPGLWAFAYPYGGLSPHAPGLLQAEGFAAAFTTVAQVEHTDRFLIGRLDGEMPEFTRGGLSNPPPAEQTSR